MAAQYPTSASGDSDLYVAVNQKSTTLTDNPLTAGATTVNVVDASSFPSVGAITIDAEIIKYTGKTGTSFTGCTRGFDGTSGVQHNVNAPVYHRVIADHHNVLKDEIKAIEGDLVAVKAALNDVDTPASTSADVKDRLDQIVSEIKRITGNTNWYDAVSNNLTQLLPLSGGSLSGSIYLPNGLVTAPSFSFVNDAASGLRYITGAGPAMVVSTNDVMQWTASIIQALQPISMNSNKVTGLAAGTTNGDAVRYEQLLAWALDSAVVHNTGTENVGGAKTFTTQLIGKGTTTNDSAAASYIGENVISSVATGSTNITTTLTFQDFTSISLTAGDWDVSGFISIIDNGATWTACGAAISTYSGEPNTDQLSGTNTLLGGGSAVRAEMISIPPVRISIAATTTVYLKGRATFSAGNPAMSRGHIRARRVR